MPSTEYLGWQAYFDIYPFTQDREDARFAMLATVIANISGKTLKHSLKETVFIPDYLREKQPAVIEKSLEQQKIEWAIFKEKYQNAQRKM